MITIFEYHHMQHKHETSLTELIIVKVAQKLLGVGYAIPPQLVLSIRHGEWASMNRGGSIGSYGVSSPTSWQETLSAK